MDEREDRIDREIAAAVSLAADRAAPAAEVDAFTRKVRARIAAGGAADGLSVSAGGEAAVERRPRVLLLVVLIAAAALVLAVLFINVQQREAPGLTGGDEVFMEVIPADSASSEGSSAGSPEAPPEEGAAPGFAGDEAADEDTETEK
ncbi:MAG: hypothetical protein LBR44_05460 [Clostridiales Family XIII bacterium]|jgi:hypothetical protein|nr:hypothetical protein [Clostridiales Family XIII bacterium]